MIDITLSAIWDVPNRVPVKVCSVVTVDWALFNMKKLWIKHDAGKVVYRINLFRHGLPFVALSRIEQLGSESRKHVCSHYSFTTCKLKTSQFPSRIPTDQVENSPIEQAATNCEFGVLGWRFMIHS